jgi:hypothetical protein
MSGPGPSRIGSDVTPKASRSSTNPSFLMPPSLHDTFATSSNRSRESTPPPMESPLPRTPKPQRFLNPPRTPLAKVSNSFGEGDDDIDASMLHAGMAIARPGSACSAYSCSSDSSVDSNTTYATADGSCTSIEDDEDGGYNPADRLTPKSKAPRNEDAYVLSAMSQRQIPPAGKGKGKERSGRKRKTQWTGAMDTHLWRTYILYQQDPKITPFFVLPGQVPPLGVCCKVARETKKSWKESRQRGGNYAPVITTPKPRTKRVAAAAAAATVETSNRGDALRKQSPYTWPASESSTRRRGC